ncbi:MAG: glycogen debranching N-terminal domain-containing protein [Solirubrobacteraceae bacterium]|nr:glycogen debranching N-terminal domain-containing protein [Solirubrobacteraceae bacterium]
MTDLADRLVIKDGNVFAVIPREGGWSGADGVWMDDCRHVSRHELRIGGAPPRPLHADDDAGHTSVHRYAGGARLERRVHADGTMVERILAPGTIELTAEGDFVTIFGLRGIVPRTPRETHRTELRRHAMPGELRVEYRFSPAPQAPAAAAFAPPRVECDDERFAAVLQRAFADMRMLLSWLDGEPYFAAGVPWYATLFGRDSLIAALQLLAFAPAVAAGTLRLLAGRIGQEDDPAREEEPGKILHELRPGETGTPLARYYGSVDATPLFLLALQATGDAGLQAQLAPAADAARRWIARRDPLTYTAGALRHQGWKDSEDGVPAPHPVALIEPQAYAGRSVEPFWLEQRGFYAMALGTDVLASNQGHVLWTSPSGRLPALRARAIRDALMGPAMFSGWGIRTLAADEPLYDPLSYHRGSVWPHDTALIAAGLHRHGFAEDYLTLFDALVDAAALAPGRRLPELFGGQARVADEPFVAYPVACRPQAWAAGAIPFLLAEGLGLNACGDWAGAAVLPSGVSELRIDGVVHASRTARGAVRVRRLAPARG